MTLRPRPALLTVWRLWLACAAVVPAFLASVLLRIGSWLWFAANAAWLAVFFVLWLWYFPRRHRACCYELLPDRLVRRSGVLGQKTSAVPRASVRLASVTESPVDHLFGLATLVVLAAGGRLILPGLSAADAREWANRLIENSD